MTFEEFFKKKRIDLDALERGNGALLFELKNHFAQMGEKSFDHTKKYWFNKLRLLYPLAIEIKTEKPKIENQLTEQTITESLIEERVTPVPKLGFVPKFRASAPPKPVEEENPVAEEPAAKPTAPLGFKPKFKASAPPKPVEEEKPATEQPVAAPSPALGFKPKFKASAPPKPVEEEKPVAEEPVDPPAPKLGFKPKFKPSAPPKPPEE